MISIVTEMLDGTTVEVGVVGRYGMAGLSAFLAAPQASCHAFVQIEGESDRLALKDFRRLVTPGTQLYFRLLRYTESFLVQSAQSAACNALHTLPQRCARWLLMVADQIGRESFHLTQEFLAQMLGVRRAGVTAAEGTLRRNGLIESSRGMLFLRDRPGLEQAACECYAVIRAETGRIFG
jgi:CRP-like cAMP-binding protein